MRTLEVEENTLLTSPGLALTDDNGRGDLLPELGLTLLNSGHDHVADGSSGQAVEASHAVLDGDDVQVLGAGVVSAVDDSADGKTDGDGELGTGNGLLLSHTVSSISICSCWKARQEG